MQRPQSGSSLASSGDQEESRGSALRRASIFIEALNRLLAAICLGVVLSSLATFMALDLPLWAWSALAGVILLSFLAERYRMAALCLTAGGVLLGSVLLIASHYHEWGWEGATLDFCLAYAGFAYQALHQELSVIPLRFGLISLVLLTIPVAWWFHGRLRLRRMFAPLVVGTLFFVLQWLVFFDPAFPHLIVFLVFSVVLAAGVQAVDYLETAGKADFAERVSPAAFPGQAAFLACGALILALILPHQLEPWDAGSWQNTLTQVFPQLEEMRGGERSTRSSRFSLSGAGFGDVQRLGGPVILRDAPALSVRLDSPSGRRGLPPGPYYLRGRVLDYYTGAGWTVSRELGRGMRWGPWDERLAQETGSAPSGEMILQEIHPLELETSTLFSIGSPSRVELSPRLASRAEKRARALQLDGPLGCLAGELALSTRAAENEPYRVISLVPHMPRDPRHPPSSSGDSEIDPCYLQLPKDLPERVISLAKSLVASQDTDWDKIQALLDHVRQYPYTLSPSEPGGGDFVDHFLFSERKGYCTYHSTALAVMLRAVGLPSRWVQGFILPATSRVSERDEEPVFLARQRHAHSWVEVHLPGWGWLPLEATPAYPNIAHVMVPAPEERPSSSGRDPAVPGGQGAPKGPEELKEMLLEQLEGGWAYPEGESSRPSIWFTWQGWLLLAGSLVLGYPLLAAALTLWSDRKVLREISSSIQQGKGGAPSSSEAQLAGWLALTFYYLSRFSGSPPAGSTARQRAAFAAGAFPTLSPSIDHMVEQYESRFYGPAPEAESESPTGPAPRELARRCLNSVRQSTGLLRFAWLRYLTPAIRRLCRSRRPGLR